MIQILFALTLQTDLIKKLNNYQAKNKSGGVVRGWKGDQLDLSLVDIIKQIWANSHLQKVFD